MKPGDNKNKNIGILAGILLISTIGSVILSNPFSSKESVVQSVNREESVSVAITDDENTVAEEPETSSDTKETQILEDPYQELKVHFIDVGQGDCTLIESDGKSMLIDAGPDNCGTKIQKYLDNNGVSSIDYLVLTHPDSDHIGSVDVVATKFDIGKIYMSSFIKDNEYYHKMMDAFSYKKYGWEVPQEGYSFNLGEAEVVFLHSKEYEDPNNSSLCIKVIYGDTSFLFAGDAEELAENDMISDNKDLSASVYHVSHHGSYTSSSQAFLDRVNPKYAVVSCGKDNEYGHPHQETLDKLRTMNIALFRTDIQGNIVADSDGNIIKWSTVPDDEYRGGSSDLEKKLKMKEAGLDPSPSVVVGAVAAEIIIKNETDRTDADVLEPNYIGNKKNLKLHRSSCTGKLPKESNREYFYSLDEAVDAGYNVENECQICHPFSGDN